MVRRIAVVLGLVLGTVASMGVQCEAATFTCAEAAPGVTVCYCRAVAASCEDMGDCLASCPEMGQ